MKLGVLVGGLVGGLYMCACISVCTRVAPHDSGISHLCRCVFTAPGARTRAGVYQDFYNGLDIA